MDSIEMNDLGQGQLLGQGRLYNPPVLYGPPPMPEVRNTTVWIRFLPPVLTYTTLFRSIRNVGRIKVAKIYGPDAKNPHNSAARLTFFSHDAAERLYQQSFHGTLIVGGMVPIVSWSRFQLDEDPASDRSRVLRIVGPPEIANRAFLEAFWRGNFHWFTDEVTEIGEVADGTAVVWYSFGSWLGQSGIAMSLLLLHFGERITVTYEPDPCGD